MTAARHPIRRAGRAGLAGVAARAARAGVVAARARAGVVGLVVFTVGLSACGVPRPGLSNGSVSACFRALPTARSAIHEQSAHIIGLHRVAADTVEAHIPTADRPVGDQDASVCAVVFQGSFVRGQVSLAPSDEEGHYAVVLIGTKNLKLIASFVVDQLPRRLGKRLI